MRRGKRKLKTESGLKVAYVQWYDHFSEGGWHDIESLKESDVGKLVESVGFVIFEDHNCIKLAKSVCSENETCADPVTILKKTVVYKAIIEEVLWSQTE